MKKPAVSQTVKTKSHHLPNCNCKKIEQGNAPSMWMIAGRCNVVIDHIRKSMVDKHLVPLCSICLWSSPKVVL